MAGKRYVGELAAFHWTGARPGQHLDIIAQYMDTFLDSILETECDIAILFTQETTLMSSITARPVEPPEALSGPLPP